MLKKFLIFIIAALFTSARAAADDLLQILESGDQTQLQALIRSTPPESEQAQYYRALSAFYQTDLSRAQKILQSIPPEKLPDYNWLKNYLAAVLPLHAEMQTVESEHFILRTSARDQFLSAYALEALEKAYRELGKDLGAFPKDKIPVEIYDRQEKFSTASTLSKEILDRSGAIGICKFRRLMILSPEQSAYGYRWLDTLSHEYAHYLVNIVSGGRCPLWLNEGIAKYFETRWRLKEPYYLTPGNRTEMVRALNEGKLIPFARMEPSMVYLDDQSQVRLAFSQVCHAVHCIQSLGGKNPVPEILKELGQGRSRGQAFQKVLKLSDSEFEQRWKEFLKSENLKESPGAAPDVIKLDGQGDELEEFAGTDIRGHIRLGDRMRQSGRTDVAILQYQKALKQEPGNPIALTKLARSLIGLDQKEKALPHLEKSIAENPNYDPAYLVLGEILVEKQEWEKALQCFQEANAVNPFNPDIHNKLALIYQNLGQTQAAQKESEIYNSLKNPPPQ